MLQFYFLSIVLNAAAGYVLIAGEGPGSFENGEGFRFSVGGGTPRLILGILCVLTGLFKVLSAVGDVPVIGDIVPALAGFAAGFALIFEYYRDHRSLEGDTQEKLERILLKNRRLIGFCGLASAVLHFLFPRVLFL